MPFQAVHGRSLFDWTSGHPEARLAFQAELDRQAEAAAEFLKALPRLHDAGSIVDVGGGTGALLCALLQALPHARGTVLDLSETVELARVRIDATGLTARCRAVAHDLLSDAPPPADLYLLKWILHDWPDHDAIACLQRIREAMSPSSTLIVVERVLDPDECLGSVVVSDLDMLCLNGGTERTREEYRALLARAGLKLDDWSAPDPSTGLSALIATLQRDPIPGDARRPSS